MKDEIKVKVENIEMVPTGKFKDNKNAGGDTSSAGNRRYSAAGVAVCSYQRALCVTGLVLGGLLASALVIAYAGPQNDCTCAGKMPSDFVLEDWNVTAPTVPTATNGQPFPWHHVRLPTFAKPTVYNITIHPNLTTLEVKGQLTIEFNVEKETNFIVLNSKNLTITEKAIVGPKGHSLKIIKFLEYKQHCQLYIELREKLRRRGNYTLSLRYTMKLSQESRGLFIDKYKENGGEIRYLAATYFPPGEARSAFPCFDEPHMKAKMRLSVIRDRFHIALCGTSVSTTEDVGFYMGTGLLRDDFLESPPASPGAIGWLISDFPWDRVILARGLIVSVYAPKHVLPKTRFFLNTAKSVLEYLEGWLGVEYPLNKLDLVTLPSLDPPIWGSWGLVYYQQALLSDPDETSTLHHQEIATTLSEQLAHQWVGGMVSVTWWGDQWLYRGLEQLLGAQALAAVENLWPVQEMFLLKHTLPALWLDSLESATPIEAVVTQPSEIDNVFYELTYSKSTSLLRMLGGALSELILHSGLGDFLIGNKYSSAEPGALWLALERQLNHTISVKGIMKTWTHQSGFPLVTIARDGNSVTATQSKFVLSQTYADMLTANISISSTAPPTHGRVKWIVPVTYITDVTNNTETVWMNNTDSITFSIPAESQWLKVNSDQAGFYRVMYHPEGWEALGKILREGHTSLTPLDRTGILDDAFVLCQTGLESCATPLELTLYLPAERSLGPWRVAIDHLAAWSRRMAESAPFPMLQDYSRRLVTPIVAEFGWNDNGDHNKRLLRAVVLEAAIHYGESDSVVQAKKLFTNWMTNNTKVPPNLREVVYTAAVMHGGVLEWQHCWGKYQSLSSGPSTTGEKKALLKALGSATRPWLLHRMLEWSMDRVLVLPEDVKTVLNAVAQNPVGRGLAWRHVKANWRNLIESFGNGTKAMADIIHSVVEDMSSAFDHTELSILVRDLAPGTGSLRLAQTLEGVAVNVRWVESQAEPLANWLEEHLNAL